MSTHEVKVVRLGQIKKHPAADKLGIVDVMGYTVVVALSSWKEGDLAFYIEPDFVVPQKMLENPEYAFLEGKGRIKVKRLRGVYSQGLLMPALPGMKEGDNVMEQLGITRYEPPISNITQDSEGNTVKKIKGSRVQVKPPNLPYPINYYDLENWQKYKNFIQPGSHVICSEKIHGAFSRYVFDGKKMHIGGRNNWYDINGPKLPLRIRLKKWWKWFCTGKKEEVKSNWWVQALKDHPWIEEWCRSHPKNILMGEVYGCVQRGFQYDATTARPVRFRAFEALDSHGYYFPKDLLDYQNVPILYSGEYNEDKMRELAEGESTLNNNHVREGIVIEYFDTTEHYLGGRKKLKLVGNGYYENS